MRVLLVEEDERTSIDLKEKLQAYNTSVSIDTCNSLSSTVQYLSDFDRPVPELLIMNLQLQDGLALDFFRRTKSLLPVIFTSDDTTEAINSFEANTIGFLTKPIDEHQLYNTLMKFQALQSKTEETLELRNVEKRYQQRFLVKYGQNMQYKNLNEISHFMADGKTVYLVQKEICRKYIIENSLNELESTLLDPFLFFRVNRQFIVNIEDIKELKSYPGSRLKVSVKAPCERDIIVSREKVKSFKNWLNR